MIGSKLGQYEILAKIGEGGMGEVYRARDPRLDREVAIKVLPEHRIDHPDAAARFEREARAVAALSHPNILAIHDFGEHDGMAYAVTELLSGQSLADELKTGPLPLRRAIDIAGQIADGLAAAHEKGIVHRDLKPANLFLTPDGRVKILDFGLAKAGPSAGMDSMTATLQDGTAPGTVMGTVRYMSPEQVRGEEVDPRSDLFSFGTVLWEMLSGEIAFQRDSAVEVMNAILKEDPPDVSAENDAIPASLERIVRRCLEKAPERRFQSAQDLAFALRNSLDSTSRGLPALEAPAPGRGTGTRRIAGAALLLIAGAALGAWIGRATRAPEPPPEPVKIVPLTHSGADSGPSVSPDGETVAFVSERDGRARIWLRQMKGGIEVPLTGGPDRDPRFSPDGSSILFLRREGAILSAYRVPVIGGNPRKILDQVFTADWDPDGRRIVFTRNAGETEAPVTVLATLDLQSGATRTLAEFPGRYIHGARWSPDGERIVLVSGPTVQNTFNELLVLEAATGEILWRRTRERQFSAPAWLPNGNGFLVAESQSLLGDISNPLGRVLHLDPPGDTEETMFWVQSVWAGAIDYVRFDFLGPNRVVFDEILWRGSLTEHRIGGGAADHLLTNGYSRDRQPSYSPDGERIAFSSNRSGNADIWELEIATGQVRQLTDDPAEDWDPAYTPDGRSLLWSSNRGGNLEIWMAAADGSAARQVSQDGVDAENPTMTADGQWIVYGSGNMEKNGIWKIRPDGSDAVRLFPGAYLLAEVSPTGEWVTFLANDASIQIVRLYVARLADAEIVFRTTVPFRGFQNLIQPGRSRWMPDGQRIVFTAPSEEDRYAILVQDFRPGENTDATRRVLVRATESRSVESFGIAPDGATLTYAQVSHLRSLKMAEGDLSARR